MGRSGVGGTGPRATVADFEPTFVANPNFASPLVVAVLLRLRLLTCIAFALSSCRSFGLAMRTRVPAILFFFFFVTESAGVCVCVCVFMCVLIRVWNFLSC
jgi:hypothetical protein